MPAPRLFSRFVDSWLHTPAANELVCSDKSFDESARVEIVCTPHCGMHVCVPVGVSFLHDYTLECIGLVDLECMPDRADDLDKHLFGVLLFIDMRKGE